MAAFTMGHTTRFKWWNVVALFWWFGANSQLWAAVASVAAIVGCVLLAWVDFVHLNPRGAWRFFYMFSGACWLTVLIWLWNVWPEEDSFGMHFTFAFLLYAATSSIYVTLTLFLKKAMLGGGGLKQVAAQRAHGDARPASEAEVTAALSGTKRKPPQPRKFDQ